MVERQSVSQVQQLGKETTPGTSVAATKRLGSINLTPGIQTETNMFTPQGLKFATVQALNQEWVEGSVDGQPTYEEVIVPLSSVMGVPTSAQIMDGATPTACYRHTFVPSSSAIDTVNTWTLEVGDAVQAEKFGNVLFTAFSLDISRAEISQGGAFIAQQAQKGITLTPALAVPTALNPILPSQVSLFTATTAALLGTTQQLLTRVVSAAPALVDRFTPAWFVNAAQASFTTTVDNADGPGADFGIVLEADAVGMGWLDALRAGTTMYLRIQALGPKLYTGTATPVGDVYATMFWDLAIKAKDVDTWEDSDGVWAIPFTAQAVHDGTWGKSQQVVIINKLASPGA